MSSSAEDADRALSEALDFITRHGWPSREEDLRLAHEHYHAWLTATHDCWIGSGTRDRLPLFEGIAKVMCAGHGETAGSYYTVILVLLIEVRAREEGNNVRMRTC